MRLRDMGITPKALRDAAAEEGIIITKSKSSEIINGTAFITPEVMKVIAKLAGRTVDDLYIELGSVLEAICPLLSAGRNTHLLTCRRQSCAWWDWEKQWCCMKNNTVMGVDEHGREKAL